MSAEKLNTLFSENVESKANFSSRSLEGTAQLTSVASRLAAEVIRTINDNVEEYAELLEASKVDHAAMDRLVAQMVNFEEVDVEFIKVLDDDVIDGMLKSQQSKRSRAKSKTMTLDNYTSMLTGAIAENLIRFATGREKTIGSGRTGSLVSYTVEQLTAFNEDQEKLRKEIRNIQSKKSIMKSKADFDPNSEAYQALLRAEQQLKDMRIGRTVETVEVDTTKDALKELICTEDVEALSAKSSKELLAKIADLIK